jgi:3-hydroxyacyl-[acyl-carrier-protein] dehydratase
VDWYAFADDILLREPDRVVTRHRLDPADPFFRDHFPGRPVLPGVLATEALVQAGRVLLADRDGRWVLGSARAVRFNRFLSPGQWLVAEVRLLGDVGEDAKLAVSGHASDDGRVDPADLGSLEAAVSGRLTLRRARLASP